MKITKLGHCCLLIETKGKKIVTDPGNYTIEAHSKLQNIDYILFTHEHQDHYHLDSLKVLIQKNPKVIIFTNRSVNDLLQSEGIEHTEVVHGEITNLGGMSIMGIGEKHAEFHSLIEQSSNIGFFIDNRLWYPGDAFTDPKKSVEILALPVAGPWMKIGEAIDYALLLKPKIVFPVHDGMKLGFVNAMLEKILPSKNIQFISMSGGDSKEF